MRIDSHAHIYPAFAGIHRGMPIISQKLGVVKNGNETMQCLPPSFENSASTYEMLIQYMDWMGVDKAVLMPNVFYGYHNEYLLNAMEHYPQRLKAVALVDIMKGLAAVEELSKYHARGFRGIKIECNSSFACAADKSLAQEALMPLWEYCAREKQPVFIHLDTFENYLALEQILQRFPGLVVVICHLGAEAILLDREHADQRFDQMMSLARCVPTVYFELSAVFCSIPEDLEYPYPVANGYIRRCLEQVGAERMLWGSDYPGTMCRATYEQLINQIERHCDLTEQEKAQIMGLNANRLIFGE